MLVWAIFITFSILTLYAAYIALIFGAVMEYDELVEWLYEVLVYFVVDIFATSPAITIMFTLLQRRKLYKAKRRLEQQWLDDRKRWVESKADSTIIARRRASPVSLVAPLSERRGTVEQMEIDVAALLASTPTSTPAPMPAPTSAPDPAPAPTVAPTVPPTSVLADRSEFVHGHARSFTMYEACLDFEAPGGGALTMSTISGSNYNSGVARVRTITQIAPMDQECHVEQLEYHHPRARARTKLNRVKPAIKIATTFKEAGARRAKRYHRAMLNGESRQPS